MGFEHEYEKLWKNQAELKGKKETLALYKNPEDAPKELLYSIDSLERLVASQRKLIDTLESIERNRENRTRSK